MPGTMLHTVRTHSSTLFTGGISFEQIRGGVTLFQKNRTTKIHPHRLASLPRPFNSQLFSFSDDSRPAALMCSPATASFESSST